MRYILLVLFAFVTTFASAQVQFLGSPTTTVRNRGNFVSDSLFYLPKRQVTPTDTAAMRYAISDSSVYVWTGRAWRSIGRAGASFVSVSDTSSMLSPYIRAAGNGLTKSGQSLLVDTASIATRARVQKAVDSLGAIKGSGTVTSVSAGTGMSFTTITSTGSVAADTMVLSTRAWRRKGLDSLAALELSLSDTASMLTPYTRGSGTTNYLPKFTGSRTFGNSLLFDNGTNVGIGTTSPANELHVVGNIRLGASNAYQIGNDNKSFSITNRVTNTRALVIDTANSIFFGTLTTANGASSTLSVNMQNSSVNVDNTLNVTDTATFSGRGLFNDRVGIGTSAPARLLHVNGTNGRVRVTGGNHGLEFDDGRTGFLSGGTDIIHIYTSGNVRGVFQADGEFLVNTLTDAGAYALQVAGSIYNTTGAVLAASSGEVLIGSQTDFGDFKLQVNGNLIVRGSAGAGQGISVSHNTGSISIENSMESDGDGYIYVRNGSGTEKVLIYSNGNSYFDGGNVGIGTLSPTQKLHVNGNILTAAPSGGTAKPFKIGEAATVSPTSPNRTIRVEIDGTVYYIHAKTTND